MRGAANNWLKAARMLAGFRSARAAALAHSWPESLYAAHEGGSRTPSNQQVETYLQAFGVEEHRLEEVIDGWGLGRAKELGSARQRDLKRRAARRLVLARRLAGFASPLDAASEYGWPHQTYYSHEGGRYGMSESIAKTYGAAFGVSPGWLLRGERPSGLPTAEGIDDLAEVYVAGDDDSLPGGMTPFVSASRRATRTEVDTSRKTTASVAPLERAMAPGEDVMEVVREGIDGKGASAWGFPDGFLKMVWEVKSSNLAIVPLSPTPLHPDISLGDRALVDRDATSFVEGAEFAVRTSTGAVTIVAKAAQAGEGGVVGRIVAFIRRAR